MIEFRVLGVPAPQGSKTRMPNGALLEAGSQTGRQKVSNEQIVDAYSRTGSVWKAGKELGICGQSVHERLAAIGYKMPGRKWTDDEKDELVRLIANQVTAGEAARRLGRTFAAVTCMLNEIGVTGYKAKQPKKLPRGAGYDKASMARHLKAIEDSGVPATRYCRSHGINIDNFVNAAQTHYPERWQQLCAARSPLPEKECPNCSTSFYPANAKQTYCSRLCGSRARADRTYFGGKRMTAIGMADGICQVCGKHGHRKLTPHHVIGKENDPDNDVMIALCSGCHQLVTLLGARRIVDDQAALQTLLTLGWLRRHGDEDLQGKELYVEVNIDLEPIEDDD